MQIQLESHGDLNYGYTFANAKPDGTFLLMDVTQGFYDISVAGLPDGYYFQSATLGTLDVTDGLKIGGGDVTVPFVVQVSPSGAQVDGVVMTDTGKQACSARVVLVPEGSRRANRFFYQDVDVDRSAHYALKGIRPGDYKLFAFDGPENVAYFDLESLSPYEKQGQAVHLDAGDHRTERLKLIATGPINH